MFKKIIHWIKENIIKEYKFLLFLTILYILFTWPVNYYIIVGGGISNIDNRIQISHANSSKGAFYLSYVSELQGKLSTYLLSYIIPDWKRVDMDNYRYEETEKIEDIEFRNDLELKVANSNAIYHAYQLAEKPIQPIDVKIYVTSIQQKDKTTLKIQDQIQSIDNYHYDSIEEYKNYLQTVPENSQVTIKVIRNNQEKEIICGLYEMDNQKKLGVTLQKVITYKTTPKVKIKFKAKESGPSGGLMTTLDIYNKLTKTDYTKGKKIAGTGTIEEDGTIGQIGEVKYKLLGAAKGGADIFLVPEGENSKTCQKLKKQKNLKIKIIAVKNIEDAILKLKNIS